MKFFVALCSLVLVAGCTRWEPGTSGPTRLTRACPLKRALAVAEYGQQGVLGTYHFVVQGASNEDLSDFLSASEAVGFDVMLMTIKMNGKDTLFAKSQSVLHTQMEVDEAFNAACSLGRGRVFLTHVRYDPPMPNTGTMRVR